MSAPKTDSCYVCGDSFPRAASDSQRFCSGIQLNWNICAGCQREREELIQNERLDPEIARKYRIPI